LHILCIFFAYSIHNPGLLILHLNNKTVTHWLADDAMDVSEIEKFKEEAQPRGAADADVAAETPTATDGGPTDFTPKPKSDLVVSPAPLPPPDEA
jgi:hypothetical protein